MGKKLEDLSSKQRRELLRKRQEEEFISCAQNPVYFMRKYCKIQHPEKGKVKFDLYGFQERALNEIRNNRFNVILKARQMGISTLMGGYSLWKMLFQNDTNILVVALKQDVAKGLVKKTRIMHDNLPRWMQQKKIEDNKLSMTLDNDSRIFAETTTGDAGRSEAISMLVVDEAAFINNAQELWSSAQATLSTGGDAVVLSTPYGIGSWYHNVWVQGKEGAELIDDTENKEVWRGSGVNDFHPIKLHWSLHPDRDEAWRREMGKNLQPKEAAREYDCSFASTGNPVVEYEIIDRQESDHAEDPIDKLTVRGQKAFWRWKEPQLSENYIIGADVARGDSGEKSDYSTAQIFNVETLEQVAEYKGKIPPNDFGDLLVRLGTMYNDALVVVERNSYGWGTLQRMQNRNYRNMLWTSNDLKFVDIKAKLQNNKKVKPGIKTGRNERPLMIALMEEYVRKDWVKIKSRRLLEELRTFVWVKQSRAEHMPNYHDDLIFGLMFVLWARDTAVRIFNRDKEMSQAAASGIKTVRGNSGTEPGAAQHKGMYTSNSSQNNPYKDPQTGEDMRWLL